MIQISCRLDQRNLVKNTLVLHLGDGSLSDRFVRRCLESIGSIIEMLYLKYHTDGTISD